MREEAELCTGSHALCSRILIVKALKYRVFDAGSARREHPSATPHTVGNECPKMTLMAMFMQTTYASNTTR